MGRITGHQAFFISVLLLMACLAIIGCSNADSWSGNTTDQTGTMSAPTGGKKLQRVTLRITGMS